MSELWGLAINTPFYALSIGHSHLDSYLAELEEQLLAPPPTLGESPQELPLRVFTAPPDLCGAREMGRQGSWFARSVSREFTGLNRSAEAPPAE